MIRSVVVSTVPSLRWIMGRRASMDATFRWGAPHARSHLHMPRSPPSLCNIDHANVVSWTRSAEKDRGPADVDGGGELNPATFWIARESCPLLASA